MDNITFSVTIPAFKPQYLEECIQSILEQSYSDFEIIIVDDASPYHLETIVAKYDDKRIHYYRNEKGFGAYNVVGNWNECLKHATGDFLICMGDDDKLAPQCLERYCELIDKYPSLDVYHARTVMIDEESNIIDMQEPRPEHESVFSMMWNLWKGRDQYIGDFLFRTEALRAAGGFFYLPYAWSSDKITAYMLAAHKGIANSYEPGFLYRKNIHTITNSTTTQKGRCDSLLGEKRWLEEFLAKAVIPSDETEKIYYALCRQNVDTYMRKTIFDMVSWDVQDNPSHIFYWMRNRVRYFLSNRDVVHFFSEAIHVLFSRFLSPILKIIRR